jgi:lysophospholipase L1-like esterase
VLGDSVVFGLGLEDDAATLCARLERELAGLTEVGGPVECVNAGVCGWSPWQAQRWLAREGAAHEPDLVVLGFVLNDLTERYRLARFGGDTAGAQLEYARSDGWRAALAESGAVLALRELRMRRSLRAEDDRFTAYHAILEPGSPRVAAAWELVAGELAALRAWCTERDVPFLVVAFPYAVQLLHPGYDAPQRRLAEETGRLGVPLLDLQPAFEARVRGGAAVEELFLDAVHLTAAGHALAADALARAVVAGALLP